MDVSVIVSLIDRYSAEAGKFKKTVTGMRDHVRKLGRGISEGVRSELTPRFSTENFDRSLAGLESRVGQARSRLMGAIGKTLALAAPVKMAADFSQSFKGLEKVVDAPLSRLRELRKFALDTSATVPVAASELIDLMAEAAQGGVPTADLERFTAFASRMAVAADMTGAAIGETFAKIRNTYRLNQEGIEALGDSANHLSNKMAAKAREIFAFTRRAAGAAGALKLNVVEMNAIGATLIASGIVPETAATGFEVFANRLVNGSKKVNGAFRALGTSRQAVLKDFRERGAIAFADFLDLVASKGDDGRRALTDIVGLEYSDDFGKLLANPELLREALSYISDPKNYKGSALEEASKQAEGEVNRFRTLMNKLARSMILVGEQMLPPLMDLADMLGHLADGFSGWAQANPELAGALVKTIAGLMAMSIAMRVLGFLLAGTRLGLFRFLGLFMRFDKAGRNVALLVKPLRWLAGAATWLFAALAPARFKSALAGLAMLRTLGAPALSLLAGKAFLLAGALGAVIWAGHKLQQTDWYKNYREKARELGASIARSASENKAAWDRWGHETGQSIRKGISRAKAEYDAGARELGASIVRSVSESKAAWDGWGHDLGARIRQGLGQAKADYDSWATGVGKQAVDWLGKQFETLSFDVDFSWPDIPEWLTWLREKAGQLLSFDLSIAWPEMPDWLQWLREKMNGLLSLDLQINWPEPPAWLTWVGRKTGFLDDAQDGQSGTTQQAETKERGKPFARPSTTPSVPTLVPPSQRISMDEANRELGSIMDAFSRGGKETGNAIEQGADAASTKLKSAGSEAGNNLGDTASAKLKAAASSAGTAFGQAAAAVIRNAQVNVRVAPVASRGGRGKAAALHDGVDE